MSLINEAWHARRSGWDFSWLEGRVQNTPTPWDYAARARELVGRSRRLLDMDTGGGEFLAALAPLPVGTMAVESWQPNIAVARKRLAAFDVTVVETPDALEAVPAFDLILNRHGRLNAEAFAARSLTGGVLLTQQVGSRNQLELNEALGAGAPTPPDAWTLDVAVGRLTSAGFEIVEAREAMLPFRFLDIGAVVYQLAAVPWQVPGFDPDRYAGPLRRLEQRIADEGGFAAHDHRFLIEARRT